MTRADVCIKISEYPPPPPPGAKRLSPWYYEVRQHPQPAPKSSSPHLRMQLIILRNVRMPTILTRISMMNATSESLEPTKVF